MVDFDGMRERDGGTALLREAEAALAALPSQPSHDTFVHGDLWEGNVLFDGNAVTGLVDWDCAGVGHPVVDLGSLRSDAALSYGPDGIDEILVGWESVARHAAPTSPATTWWRRCSRRRRWRRSRRRSAGQGRPDITAGLLVERRDAFLADALERLATGHVRARGRRRLSA